MSNLLHRMISIVWYR